METQITILNGIAIHNLIPAHWSQLRLQGYGVAAISNFSNFEVDRKVFHHRSESNRGVTNRNEKFFPRGGP